MHFQRCFLIIRSISFIWDSTMLSKRRVTVVTVKAYDDISDVARIMRDKHIKRVPVLDDEGHLIGIVSRQDIVKMLL